MSVLPVSDSTNSCSVSTSSVSTSRFRSCPPSRFRSRPTNRFRSRPPSRFQSRSLPFNGYESGQPVSKRASQLQNGLGCESGLNIYTQYVFDSKDVTFCTGFGKCLYKGLPLMFEERLDRDNRHVSIVSQLISLILWLTRSVLCAFQTAYMHC